MTDFEFTRVYDSGDDYKDSSYVQAVYHNENEDFVVVDLDGTYYKYNNVPADAVADLVSAYSVGAHFNTDFKTTYGPSEELGEWFDVTEYAVPANKNTPGTPKGLVDATNTSGFEYNLNRFDIKTNQDVKVFDAVESNDVFGGTEPTKEYSLTLPDDAAVEVDDDIRVTVHFTLDGFDKKYKYVAKATDVNEAVEELNDYVASFGATGKVRKVVVNFE